MSQVEYALKLKQLGIDTYKEAVVYMREDCDVCRAEGFEVHARVRVNLGERSILATLNMIEDGILAPGEAGLSKYAWKLLAATEGDKIRLYHPKPLQSLSFVRSKIYGHTLSATELQHIINDIAAGRYSDIHIAAFLTSCAGDRLSETEILSLTKAMITVGACLEWPSSMVVDKHCVGGLPGNRTTLIVVPIIAAFGLMMPKTSSRAITSPAGTADTMEVLAPVDLDLRTIRKVVEKEQGCIVWGGSVALSPADDILIRVERAIDLDSEGQLVASVLSKKVAVGSTHVVIDIPIGPTTKVRSKRMAETLKCYLETVGNVLGVTIDSVFSDGMQPVGRGIGPALEARDVLAVLQGELSAPQDLRDRALTLAGKILEFSLEIPVGTGKSRAQEILDSGGAWRKFQAICDAQGGLREPMNAQFTREILSTTSGKVVGIDNRQLSRLAKLAGAPNDKAAGIELHARLETQVERGQPLFTLHAESKGELNYALSLLEEVPDIVKVGKEK